MIQPNHKGYLLSQVPEHIVANPNHLKPEQFYTSQYNVAAWIKFLKPGQDNFRLCLKYRDQEKEHLTELDQGFPNASQQVLASGIATVKTKGPITNMQVLVVSADKKLDFKVEELFVQRKEDIKKDQKRPSPKRSAGR